MNNFINNIDFNFFQDKYISIILYIFLGIIVSVVADVAVKKLFKLKYKRDKRTITLIKLIRSIFKYIVWFIVIIMILEEFGVDTKAIIASAGILGLAVGFGAQDLVKDVLSGFFIIFEEQFNVQDIIEIDGFKGEVVSIGLKTTRIKNWKGEVKIISNGSISNVINYSLNNSLAIVDFNVDYKTDLDTFKQLFELELDKWHNQIEGIKKRPIYLGVTNLGESGIDLRVIAETLPMEHFGVEREIRDRLKTFCEKENIIIPFPQVVIHND